MDKVISLILILVLIFGIQAYNTAQCHALAEPSGLESKWTWFRGCQVEYEGKWIPLMNYDYGQE